VKKSRYTEEQIAYALKQAVTGIAVSEVIGRMGDFRADVLSLEEAVRRSGCGRAAQLRGAMLRSSVGALSVGQGRPDASSHAHPRPRV